jgi:hypothetical protein
MLRGLRLFVLEIVDATGRQDFWAKKTIDRTLRISKYLCEQYNLKPDGHANAEQKKKKKKRK